MGTYHDIDVLEGFAADAEYLGRESDDNEYFDKDFYELCQLDNLYIFEFKGDEPVTIAPMTMTDLDK